MRLTTRAAIARLVRVGLAVSVFGCTQAEQPATFQGQSDPGVVYPADVAEFVKLTFPHGVPFEAASTFAPSAVPVLLDILADPRQEAVWPNTVATLGMIGDARAVDPLIAFIGSGQGRLTPVQYAARSGAVMALGYIVNRSQHPKALTYLRESTSPDVWQRRQFAWASPYASTDGARNLQLSEVAILGLALSAQPSAAEALRDLQAQGVAAGADDVRRRLGALATDALGEHALIANKGLAEYYR